MSATTYDATRREWLVLATVSTEAMTRSFWLARAQPESARTILEGGSVIAERVSEIERALAPARALPAVPNLIAHGRYADSSVARYVQHVMLGPPLEGVELEIAVGDLERREHTISLKAGARSSPVHAGPAARERGVPRAQATLRRELCGRASSLCVLPLSILYAGLSPGGDSIALLLREHSRSEQAARDRHWIGRLPSTY